MYATYAFYIFLFSFYKHLSTHIPYLYHMQSNRSPTFWLICPDSNNISNIIENTIKNFSFSDLLDISSTELQQLCNNLITHYCFSSTHSISFNTTTFYTTIQGFIPIPLINIVFQY